MENICTRAWHDDDYDGPEGWQVEHLWAYSNGTYSTCDADGNHEPFPDGWSDEGVTLEDEVNSYCEDADKSWLEYAQDCSRTGQDPLGEYSVQHTVKKKENWIIWFTDWIGREEHGYAVIDGRHGGVKAGRTDIKLPQDFSKSVAEYLCLKKVGDRYCMEGVTLEDIRNDVGYLSQPIPVPLFGVGPKFYMKLQISYDKPRSARAVSRDVKAAAAKAVERHLERQALELKENAAVGGDDEQADRLSEQQEIFERTSDLR
jgi:hypothetical protein